MHEMSLCQNIAELIEDAARRERFDRVRTVTLEVGRLAAVEPEALEFCFDAAMRGGCAEGARLEIVAADGRAWCLACSREILIARPLDPCPCCGGGQIQVTGGTQLRIKELEVE